MRNLSKNLFTLLVLTSCILTSCNDDENNYLKNECAKGEEVYDGEDGSKLTLTNQYWYLEENDLNGVDVGVSIVGSIEGDSATIRTYGDGVFSDTKIPLNADDEFNQEYQIYFTSSPSTQDTVIAETVIMVYQAQDTLKVNISSCELPTFK